MTASADVHVFHRDMLDDEPRARCPKPWLVQWPDGHIRYCATEETACAVQRAWRLRIGLDPMSGAPCVNSAA